MANHKSAIKRIRQTESKNAVNRNNSGVLRSQLKKLVKALDPHVEGGDPAALLAPTVSKIDKAVQKGVLHKNTANRMKSRLTVRVNKAKATA